jgi:hypothetical protein
MIVGLVPFSRNVEATLEAEAVKKLGQGIMQSRLRELNITGSFAFQIFPHSTFFSGYTIPGPFCFMH